MTSASGLFNRLIFGGPTGETVSEPSLPSRLRIYAIGDIHGRVDLLAQLHQQIREDTISANNELEKVVVYLGDYVDRGLDSKSVIDLILGDPLEDFHSIFLKGNHEDALLRFLDDITVGADWLGIGGEATAFSYGVRIPQGLSSAQRLEHIWKDLRARIPKEHLEFLSNLDLWYQAGNYFFVHAGIRPGTPLDRQAPKDLMWIRDEFLSSKRDHGATIVHGHSPGSRPDIQSYRIGIDTGAFATNILTCLVLEGTTKRFLTTA